jgi:hypothetical protein
MSALAPETTKPTRNSSLLAFGAAFAVLALITATAAWAISQRDRTLTAGLEVADSAAFHSRVLALAPVGIRASQAREALARQGFHCWIDGRSPSNTSCLKQKEHVFRADMWRVNLTHPAGVVAAVDTRVEVEVP